MRLRCRLAPLLALAVCVQLAAETQPTIGFRPKVVLLQRDLTGAPLAGSSYERQSTGADEPASAECAVLVEAVIDRGWTLAILRAPDLAAGTARDGEAPRAARSIPAYERSAVTWPRADTEPSRSVAFRLRLPAPTTAVTTLSGIHGSIELVYARTDALARREYRPAAGGANVPCGIPGCDLSVSRDAAGAVVFDYAEDALLRLHAMAAVDATGKTLSPIEQRSEMTDTRRRLHQRFAAAPDHVEMSWYAEPHAVRAEFTLDEVPLVGEPAAPPEPRASVLTPLPGPEAAAVDAVPASAAPAAAVAGF